MPYLPSYIREADPFTIVVRNAAGEDASPEIIVSGEQLLSHGNGLGEFDSVQVLFYTVVRFQPRDGLLSNVASFDEADLRCLRRYIGQRLLVRVRGQQTSGRVELTVFHSPASRGLKS